MARRRRGGGRRPAPRALGARGSRRRIWVAAAGFGALAVGLALAGLLGHDPTWLRSAVLAAVLAVVWTIYAAVLRP